MILLVGKVGNRQHRILDLNFYYRVKHLPALIWQAGRSTNPEGKPAFHGTGDTPKHFKDYGKHAP